ncbi:extracellular solute-binding protein [Goodfellowiella coeruleoviolacea]|uniref:Carbohydrate ABC transporter substrate-binding protein, CUT1 family (TC 3.A.1.1.-) n=1 Tax=Goodfellowiella coeruleoviolacea TaxID=334858 RepID=A0AAE3KF75_9PSEU|nr:extracellular solute-binding protein [Goodfellowiella coeruleoviolacea]MCP2164149.1 carbohydrate ABC transporter substrate-binding protein, CUT1 family (TC 3.A.1.1.-) [Goodfellowiella coeruleoviolacea]
MFKSLGRRGAVGATMVALLTALVGCGTTGPQGGAPDDGSVHVWVLEDDKMNAAQQQAADEFNKNSSVKVVIDRFSPDSYPDKLRVAMGSPNAPDVFFNWGGGSIKSYVQAGTLVDLTPTLDAKPQLKQAFLPAVLEAGGLDGKYYGIPLRGMQPVVLFYNRDVFANAGVQPPQSWNDLLSLIDTFKSRGITPFALGGATAWTELMWVEYLVDRYGGAEVFDRIVHGDQSAWRDPSVLQAAQTVQDLVDRGAFGTNFASVDYNSHAASTLLARGNAAMHLMGSWEYANQLQDDPDFARTKLGYTTFPGIEGGKGDPANLVGNPTNYFSVSAQSKNKDTAIAFLDQMATDSYVTKLLQAGDVPTTTSAQDRLGQSDNPEFATFQYNLVQRAPEFTQSWDQALDPNIGQAVITAIQQLFNKQLTPEQFVQTVEQAR